MSVSEIRPLGRKKQDLKRFNLTLPVSCVQRLADIRELTEASSDSEVIRRALQFYEKVLKGTVQVTGTTGAGTDDEIPIARAAVGG